MQREYTTLYQGYTMNTLGTPTPTPSWQCSIAQKYSYELYSSCTAKFYDIVRFVNQASTIPLSRGGGGAGRGPSQRAQDVY